MNSYMNKNVAPQITGLQATFAPCPLTHTAFEEICQPLSVPQDSLSNLSTERKHAMVRMVIHKVIRDAQNAHMFLYGAEKPPLA